MPVHRISFGTLNATISPETKAIFLIVMQSFLYTLKPKWLWTLLHFNMFRIYPTKCIIYLLYRVISWTGRVLDVFHKCDIIWIFNSWTLIFKDRSYAIVIHLCSNCSRLQWISTGECALTLVGRTQWYMYWSFVRNFRLNGNILFRFLCVQMPYSCKNYSCSGIVFSMCSANERLRYIVTSSVIGWAHTQNDTCFQSARIHSSSRIIQLPSTS